MGRVISFASGKGGVGKTILAANIGIGLSKMGLRVCVVDADVAMANLSLIMGLHAAPITLHDVLLGQSAIYDAIYDGPAGTKLIPSGLSLESYKKVDPSRLRSIVDSLRNQFDYVLLDVAAGLERTVTAALAASDEVMLITSPDAASLSDVLKIKIIAQALGAKPIGVIINLVRKEKGETGDEDIMKMLELPAYGIIPYDDEVRKTFLIERTKPIVISNPKSPAGAAMLNAAVKIHGVRPEFIKLKKESAFGSFLNKFTGIFKRKKTIRPAGV